MAFDTMRFSQRPCEAGMSGVQAAGIAAATAEAIGELVAQPATKHDLAPPLRQELKAGIAQRERRTTLRLGTMMDGAVAVTAALAKLR